MRSPNATGRKQKQVLPQVILEQSRGFTKQRKSGNPGMSSLKPKLLFWFSPVDHKWELKTSLSNPVRDQCKINHILMSHTTQPWLILPSILPSCLLLNLSRNSYCSIQGSVDRYETIVPIHQPPQQPGPGFKIKGFMQILERYPQAYLISLNVSTSFIEVYNCFCILLLLTGECWLTTKSMGDAYSGWRRNLILDRTNAYREAIKNPKTVEHLP